MQKLHKALRHPTSASAILNVADSLNMYIIENSSADYA